jgi:hypothetical protein
VERATAARSEFAHRPPGGLRDPDPARPTDRARPPGRAGRLELDE